MVATLASTGVSRARYCRGTPLGLPLGEGFREWLFLLAKLALRGAGDGGRPGSLRRPANAAYGMYMPPLTCSVSPVM